MPNDTALVKDADSKSCVSKLKYAALGHIDLSTIDFAKRELNNHQQEGFSEKSRSVIDITSTSSNKNRVILPLRSLTRVKDGSGKASGALTGTESSLTERNDNSSSNKIRL